MNKIYPCKLNCLNLFDLVYTWIVMIAWTNFVKLWDFLNYIETWNKITKKSLISSLHIMYYSVERKYLVFCHLGAFFQIADAYHVYEHNNLFTNVTCPNSFCNILIWEFNTIFSSNLKCQSDHELPFMKRSFFLFERSILYTTTLYSPIICSFLS